MAGVGGGSSCASWPVVPGKDAGRCVIAVLCLLCQVDFEGDFPIEGGKEVGTLMTRYVSRPLRLWTAAQQEATEQRKRRKKTPAGGQQQCEAKEAAGAEAWAPSSGRLRVDESGRELTIEPVQALAWPGAVT